MSDSTVNNKRIAKNTALLYIRMLLLMVVTLFTSRVIIKLIGVEDYGIYNLIAGFVTFLSFISSALISAMQRYFNVALGKNDLSCYKDIFSMSINILLIFCVLIIFIGETLGLWFVNNHLNLPDDRLNSAILVYHISIFTFIANTLRTPYHASIIAHEKMNFYAYISIIEVVARLFMVFLLQYIPIDHLIMYAISYFVLILIIDFCYWYYCHKCFYECRYSFNPNRKLFYELLGFSGWSLLGNGVVVLKGQGESILINKFFSVVANAANGIASQVTSAVDLFVVNFQTAFKPQITQTYASGKIEEHKELIFRTSKFSYYLLLFFVVPIVYNIDSILSIWLEIVPEYTNKFVIYVLLSHLINVIGTPFAASVIAKGDIKFFQISTAFVFGLSLFVVYFVLYAGFPPYSIAVVAIFTQCVLLTVRLCFFHYHIGVSYRLFFKKVIAPIMCVNVVSIILPTILLFEMKNCMIYDIFELLIDFIYVGLMVFLVGLSKSERSFILKMIKLKK